MPSFPRKSHLRDGRLSNYYLALKLSLATWKAQRPLRRSLTQTIPCVKRRRK
ncbi:hypothetical protein EMPG_15507 [Blastomyces silverae]|uniref:Uncharacterized protein n=1 Tax=Blastomyces silverae TaxID=2060906 RepID=A0A0H1BDE8_9EURO|nr:hypothetical protein EMPG_15507 [Blastomyces silverae]